MKTIYIESINENVKPDTKFPYEKTVIRQPKLPKVAKVTRYKQIGAREWVTIYHVKNEYSQVLFSHGIMGKAINWAKKRVLKDLKELYVCVGKALVGSDNMVATVSPGKFRPGKFKFTIIEK